MNPNAVIEDAAPKTFGEVVKYRRTQLGLTQATVGERISISATEVCKIERGNRYPNIKVAAALLATLALDSAYLMRTICEQSAAHSGLGLEEFMTIAS